MCNLCRLDKGQDTLRRFFKVGRDESGNQPTQANAVVAPVHSKAMPVLLTTADEQAAWLSAPPEEALKLQRPLPDEALRMVAMVEKADEWAPVAAAE
jgi:hypothetical protein